MPPWGNFDKRISKISKGATVWRYIDLAKFVDLFVKRRLYFRRSDLLDDSFEGMPTAPLREYLYDQYRDVHKVAGVFEDPVAVADQTLIELRECNFINSWYLSEYESAAMWSLYSKIGSGIAIQSTVENLHAAIPLDIYIGKVIYVDYHVADEIDHEDDLRSLFFIKRNYFEHEREIRVLYSISEDSRDPKKTGHYVDDVDLERMIRSVILAPDTPNWFRESIEAFMQKVLPSIEVRESSLDAKPPIKSSKLM